ncbi:hypothetical protein BV25DRAFT_1915961 [Artomyces pyxidatus]|uniref:Uncharacterized protein n=1 Tax=Artomyces pyxidatus TaxID=48021 RepID=A0ACB8T2Q2_9AGAM|nr:hypothetical protein BV25DRAFT_1915961 [Artomyces pyxidatus]
MDQLKLQLQVTLIELAASEMKNRAFKNMCLGQLPHQPPPQQAAVDHTVMAKQANNGHARLQPADSAQRSAHRELSETADTLRPTSPRPSSAPVQNTRKSTAPSVSGAGIAHESGATDDPARGKRSVDEQGEDELSDTSSSVPLLKKRRLLKSKSGRQPSTSHSLLDPEIEYTTGWPRAWHSLLALKANIPPFILPDDVGRAARKLQYFVLGLRTPSSLFTEQMSHGKELCIDRRLSPFAPAGHGLSGLLLHLGEYSSKRNPALMPVFVNYGNILDYHYFGQYKLDELELPEKYLTREEWAQLHEDVKIH